MKRVVGSLALLICATAAPANGMTDICRIAAHPVQFAGKVVTFRAEYKGDLERAVVFDQFCPGRKGIGVNALPEGPAGDEWMRMNPPIPTVGPKFRTIATFVGKIVRVTPNKRQFHSDDGFRVDILSFSNVQRLPERRIR